MMKRSGSESCGRDALVENATGMQRQGEEWQQDGEGSEHDIEHGVSTRIKVET